MIDPKYSDKIKIAQEKLDSQCPLIDKTIISLSKLFYADISKWNEKDSNIAKSIVEVDELIKQLRWHYGYALLIKEIYPSITKYDMKNISKYEDLPAQVMLGLREFVSYSNLMMVEDYEANWFGGTYAGWLFHMMIDNTMIRLISAFDRIALLLFLISDIPMHKVYFRSGKMKLLHKKLNMIETQQLLNISLSSAFNDFFISYRDNIIHTKSAFSRMSGFIPTTPYFENSKLKKNDSDLYWDTEILTKLVGAGYKVLSDVLELTVSICSKTKKPANNAPH